MASAARTGARRSSRLQCSTSSWESGWPWKWFCRVLLIRRVRCSGFSMEQACLSMGGIKSQFSESSVTKNRLPFSIPVINQGGFFVSPQGHQKIAKFADLSSLLQVVGEVSQGDGARGNYLQEAGGAERAVGEEGHRQDGVAAQEFNGLVDQVNLVLITWYSRKESILFNFRGIPVATCRARGSTASRGRCSARSPWDGWA